MSSAAIDLEIAFSDVDVSSDGVITALVTRSDYDVAEVLRIELPYSFRPKPDLLALTFACLCGTKYSRVIMDLAIPNSCKETIERFTRGTVSVVEAPETRRRPGDTSVLNFSGGLDSLAASSLMPGCELISLDFGGRFSREERFFRRFGPNTVRTNLVDIGLNRNHWSFMAVGSILMRDELRISTYAFGEIMGGTAPGLLNKQANQRNANLPQAEYLGMSVFKPVAGLTEIGAIRLGLHEFGSLIPRALQSVALPTEEKYLRKFLMLGAVLKSDSLPYTLAEPATGPPRSKWGRSYANDLSTLYVSKILGPEAASSAYDGDGVPSAVHDFASQASLTFFERVNPHAYGGVENRNLQRIYNQLTAAGLLPYGRNDWEELSAATKLLRQ